MSGKNLLVYFLILFTCSCSPAWAATSTCCKTLVDIGLGDQVTYPGEEAFSECLGSYYSTAAAAVVPACIFRPLTAGDVSEAVKALVPAECKFAVRSGGQSHIAGAASIQDGVNIDLSWMNSTSFHAENSTASILPGARWGSVYQALDQLGVRVSGARSSSIGVGGFLLGGGLSFYSPKRGMSCDRVRQIEVVLASGEIVYSHDWNNAELFKALKGGGNNFGIVTRFDIDTFEGGEMWGGTVVYPNYTIHENLQSLVAFTDKNKEHPSSTAVMLNQYTSSLESPKLIGFFADTDSVEQPSAFDEFFNISGIIADKTGPANMSSLAAEFESPLNYRATSNTVTLKNDIRVLNKAHELFNAMVKKLREAAKGEFRATAAYVPLPTAVARQGYIESGNNALDLDVFDTNHIIFEPYLQWYGAEQDELFQSQARLLNVELTAFAEGLFPHKMRNMADYINLNSAASDQDPLASYGCVSVDMMQRMAKRYDPDGVFQKLVPGGFKISKVGKTKDECIFHDEL